MKILGLIPAVLLSVTAFADTPPPFLSITNAAGRVWTVKRPSPTRTGKLVAGQQVYEYDHCGNVRDITPPPPPVDVRLGNLEAHLKRLQKREAELKKQIEELKYGKGN